MSELENFPEELADLNREIHHWAAICGIDYNDGYSLEQILVDHSAHGARETLRGLLILRLRVETAMLDCGHAVPTETP